MSGLEKKHPTITEARCEDNQHSPWAGIPHPRWLGPSPEGVQARLGHDIWYLSDWLPGDSPSKYTINWRTGWDAGISIGRVSYWLGLAKRLTYYCMESDKTRVSRTTTLAVYAYDIRAMCNWLCCDRRCLDVSHVTTLDVLAYEKYLGELGLTRNTVTTKLVQVRLLWILRSELGEGLAFDPYILAGSLKRKAKTLGRRNCRTPTIVPGELFRMLNTAIELLNDGDQWLAHISSYVSIREQYPPKGRAKAFQEQTGISTAVFTREIRLLYGAAIITVFALLGERKHELSATKTQDVIELLEGDASELLGTVRKTAPNLSGLRTHRPVVDELKQALSVVFRLTSDTRKEYKGDRLFIRGPLPQTASSNPQIELSTRVVYGVLDHFASKVGFQRRLRPHMFRRAFSMLWVWRFELGDMQTLSRLLYHNNEMFTRYYTEGEDVWQFLPEAERDFTHEVMERAILGKNRVVGGVSNAFRRYSRLIQSQVTLLTPEAVHNFVERLVNQHNYRVVPQADGYCVMSDVRGARSKCSTDGKQPNYSNRDDSHCVGCANFGVDESRRGYWEARKASHQRVLAATDLYVLQQASREAVKRAETVLRWVDHDSRKGKYERDE